jgi:hypothetical protein
MPASLPALAMKLHGFAEDVQGCAMTQAAFARSPPPPFLIKL